MEQSSIFTPVFALFLLTLIVWIYLYAKRIPWIQASNLTPEQMTPHEFERIQPDAVRHPSDNFKNLFEIPVLFYVLCIYLYATGSVDGLYVAAAWGFVLLRYLHSAVHCTVNVVLLRFALYFIGTSIFWLMTARAALQHFGVM